MLDSLDDDRLRADMIWSPAWGTATLDVATSLTPAGRDPRERVWFDDGAELGNDIADKVPGNAPVYDLLMIFEPGQTWGEDGDDTLPEPALVWTPPWTVEDLLAEIDARLPECSGGVIQ